jgi:hypothetical protein
MSARVWTREELDRVHPLPKGDMDGFGPRPPWFWRVDPTGPVAFSVCHSVDGEVWVDAAGRLCSSDGDPPWPVALAVILASQGLDSREAMADEVGAYALAAGRDGRHDVASQLYDVASLVRRGRVEP